MASRVVATPLARRLKSAQSWVRSPCCWAGASGICAATVSHRSAKFQPPSVVVTPTKLPAATRALGNGSRDPAARALFRSSLLDEEHLAVLGQRPLAIGDLDLQRVGMGADLGHQWLQRVDAVAHVCCR